MNTFNNIVKAGEDSSLGIAIQKLIEDNISRLNTSFLAKITNVSDGGLVDIIEITKIDESISNPIISNCIYGIPSTGNWKVSQKPAVGDYGLAIVLKRDNSTYKVNKEGGVINSNRLFNINDTIFLPLTLLNQPSTDDYSISNKDDKVKINLSNDTMTLTTEKSSITLKDTMTLTTEGKISIISKGAKIELDDKVSFNNKGKELKDILDGVVKVLNQIPQITGQVVVPPTIATDTAILQADIKTFFG